MTNFALLTWPAHPFKRVFSLNNEALTVRYISYQRLHQDQSLRDIIIFDKGLNWMQHIAAGLERAGLLFHRHFA